MSDALAKPAPAPKRRLSLNSPVYLCDSERGGASKFSEETEMGQSSVDTYK